VHKAVHKAAYTQQCCAPSRSARAKLNPSVVAVTRAAKTLMIYLMETNGNVYSWLLEFYKANPIPKVGQKGGQPVVSWLGLLSQGCMSC
jgi:hypothetical protein